MANKRNGNTIYVDTAGTLTSDKNMHVVNVIVTATAASAVVVLSDPDGTSLKADLRVADSGVTQQFAFLPPMFFPNGIRVTTLTNAIATVIYNRSGGES
jgi:hypothetical protein